MPEIEVDDFVKVVVVQLGFFAESGYEGVDRLHHIELTTPSHRKPDEDGAALCGADVFPRGIDGLRPL